MKKNYLLISLFSLLFLFACSSTINLAPLLNTNQFLLVETTTGSSYEDARGKAISLLNQDISVKINNTFASSEVLQNNNYSMTAQNNVNLESNGYFQDLVFSKPHSLKNGQYKISVGLSAKALVSTINFLSLNLNNNHVNDLEFYKLDQENNKINFLLALLLYAKSNNIVINNYNDIYNSSLSYQKAINYRLVNSSRLSFNLLPDVSNASIIINNKQYPINKPIFLTKGKYSYTITSPTYKPVTNSIELLNNDQINVTVYMQQKLDRPLIAKLVIKNDNNIDNMLLNNSVIAILKNNQINITTGSSYNLVINLTFAKQISNNFEGLNSSSLPINFNIVKNNQSLLSKNSNITYVGNTSDIPITYITKKLNDFIAETLSGSTLNSLQ
ncbi:hypothetical protein ACFX5K_04165 [Rickettsiales bacterium LUAb2]